MKNKETQMHVRYDFKWCFVGSSDNHISAVVTRNEWPEGYHITNLPTNVSQFKIIVEQFSVAFRPVDEQKTFRAIPDVEHEQVTSIARAYYCKHMNEREMSHWVHK